MLMNTYDLGHVLCPALVVALRSLDPTCCSLGDEGIVSVAGRSLPDNRTKSGGGTVIDVVLPTGPEKR